MKLLSLPEAERSMDMDIKMVAGRASRYRVFGSPERILDAELAVVDLRDGVKPDDYPDRFRELDRHVAAPIFLVRKLG
ncbi:MAG TPA: hypothetical protein VE262_04955 [Blastocatellia bacterium]|nr:hypothetical protein [Blastocatellia bacterium]